MELLSNHQLNHFSKLLAGVAASANHAHFHTLHEALVRIKGLADIYVGNHYHGPAGFGQLDGGLDHFGMGAEHHHGIRTFAAGDIPDLLAKIWRRRVDAEMGAVFSSPLELA